MKQKQIQTKGKASEWVIFDYARNGFLWYKVKSKLANRRK